MGHPKLAPLSSSLALCGVAVQPSFSSQGQVLSTQGSHSPFYGHTPVPHTSFSSIAWLNEPFLAGRAGVVG